MDICPGGCKNVRLLACNHGKEKVCLDCFTEIYITGKPKTTGEKND